MKNELSQKSALNFRTVFWIYLIAFFLMTWSFRSSAAAKEKAKETKDSSPVVVIDTSMGKIEVKLNKEKAPISVENFLKYVDKKFYDQTIFHRVIPTFMIQGGGHTADLKEKEVLFKPIDNEAKNGLSNLRGTIAMARTSDKNSATAQFYINVEDNFRNLDHKSEEQYGYAVFGEVTKGLDVVDKIKDVKTEYINGMGDVPRKTVTINSIRLKK